LAKADKFKLQTTKIGGNGMSQHEVIQNGLKEKQVGEYFDGMKLTKRHWAAGLILFFAFVIEAWELMMIIFVTGDIALEFDLSAVQVGSLIGSMSFGLILGSYLWGMIIDKIGRKKTMIYSFIGFGIVSLISSFSVSYEMLYGLRFIAGVIFAGVIVGTFPYFQELLPVKSRGRAGVYLSAGFPLGILLAVGVTATFIEVSGDFHAWRIIMIISSLAALWSLLIFKIPESPYWLAGKGRAEEAKKVIEYLSYNTVTVPAGEVPVVQNVKQGNYFAIFKKPFLKRTVFQTIIHFTFNVGYWGLMAWIPTLLMQKGLSMGQSLGFVALTAVFQIPGYIAASYFTGIYGRKKVMAVFVSGAIIAGYAFAFASTMTQLYAFNFTLGFFLLGIAGIWNTWSAEIYPSNIRAAGYSFGVAAQRWANALAPSLIGILIGMGFPFVVTVSFIITFLIATLISLFFLKETEGEILR
jgi:putative MFS transporter